jgi:hypothetical protein
MCSDGIGRYQPNPLTSDKAARTARRGEVTMDLYAETEFWLWRILGVIWAT